MKYIVTSVGLEYFSNKLTARNEVIDTNNNSLFADCNTKEDVIEVYEYFWNTPAYAQAIVKVFEIAEIAE
jgi:hypothetical protein